MLKVQSVKHDKEYCLVVVFNDGKKKIVDLKEHLWGDVFVKLKDIEVFKMVSTDGYTICWDEVDFAPEFLYQIGKE